MAWELVPPEIANDPEFRKEMQEVTEEDQRALERQRWDDWDRAYDLELGFDPYLGCYTNDC